MVPPRWPDDGGRDCHLVTLKTQQWRGNVAVLSQTPCPETRPATEPVFRVVPGLPDARRAFRGRRGAERKSSFDVCLSDFEWEKPDEKETRRENKSLRHVKKKKKNTRTLRSLPGLEILVPFLLQRVAPSNFESYLNL